MGMPAEWRGVARRSGLESELEGEVEEELGLELELELELELGLLVAAHVGGSGVVHKSFIKTGS